MTGNHLSRSLFFDNVFNVFLITSILKSPTDSCQVFTKFLETPFLQNTSGRLRELVGKIKLKSSKLPRRITVNKVGIFDDRKIANEFNAFFKNIGSKLVSKIPNASTTFETYINKPDSIMETKRLSMNELKDAFFSLKINKSPGYDDISFNVLKKCFSSLM